MKHALYIPPFGEMADPAHVLDAARLAESQDWDGLFLWDHLLRPFPEPAEVGHAWSLLAAIATHTQTLRLGPMVTPLTRRRPQIVAKEATAVDWLSRGRLTIGIGLGVDDAGELSKFGELTNQRDRGDLLDEALPVLAGLLEGEPIRQEGKYVQVSDAALRPAPIQTPRPPIWLAARGSSGRAIRRATAYEGVFAINVDAAGVSRIAASVAAARGGIGTFDIAVVAIPGVDLAELEAAGATWAMWTFLPGCSAGHVFDFIQAGPGRWAS